MKAIMLGTQPKGRECKEKQMGSKLSPKRENFKPHSDKVIRPREVISVWEGGDIPFQRAETSTVPRAYLPEV